VPGSSIQSNETPSNETPSQACRTQRHVWLDRFVMVAVLLASSLAIAKNNADADLWGHVTFGMNVIADGQLPSTASHTFTAEGYRWINHENLAEISLAFITGLGGGTGLLLFKCVLGLLVLGLILDRARHQAGVMLAGLLTIVVAINLTATWTLRPQLFSYACFAVMIALLDTAFAKFQDQGLIRAGFLWAIVPLMCLWTNSHGGFVAGCAVFGLYMVCRATQLILKKPNQSLQLAAAGRLAFITLCVVVATLLNPYGPRLHQWMIASLGQPRPEITEWVALSASNTLFWPFVSLAILAAFSYSFSRQRRDVTHLIVIAAVAWQSVEHVRHVPFLAILVGYWLPEHLRSACRRVRDGFGLAESRDDDTVPGLALIGGAAMCLVLTAVLWQRCREVYVDKSEFPVDAISFMAEHNLNGRLVVTYNWAQYALAALGPETSVAFDGRFRTCYPQDVVDMHFDFILGDAPGMRWRGPDSLPFDGTRALEHGSPDLALIDRSQEHGVLLISQHPDWILLYEDGMAQVWGRKSKFDTPTHPDYMAADQRRVNLPLPEGRVPWPAFPAHRSGQRHAATNIHGFPRSST